MMNPFRCWLLSFHQPDLEEIWLAEFWDALTPKYQKGNSRRSPWYDDEIKPDLTFDEAAVALEEMGLTVNMVGGYCPVQVEAILPNGDELYFRAIRQSWSCEISDKDEFVLGGDWGMYPFHAGYMPLGVVLEFIKETLKAWESRRLSEYT